MVCVGHGCRSAAAYHALSDDHQTSGNQRIFQGDELNILEFHDVKKDYRLGETIVHALRGVDLAVSKGEFAAILGASGSGKTTLLNLAGAIDEPSAGSVVIDGQDISRLSSAACSAPSWPTSSWKGSAWPPTSSPPPSATSPTGSCGSRSCAG